MKKIIFYFLFILFINFNLHGQVNHTSDIAGDIANDINDPKSNIFFKHTSRIASSPAIDNILSGLCEDIYRQMYNISNPNEQRQNIKCRVFHILDKDNIDIIPINDNIFIVTSGFFIRNSEDGANILFLDSNLLKLMLTFTIASRVLKKNPDFQISYSQVLSNDLYIDGRGNADIQFFESLTENYTDLNSFFYNKNDFNAKISKITNNTFVSNLDKIKLKKDINSLKSKFLNAETNTYYNSLTGFTGGENFISESTVQNQATIEGFMQYLCERKKNCQSFADTYLRLSLTIINDDRFLARCMNFFKKNEKFLLNKKLLNAFKRSQDILNDTQNQEDNANFLFVSQLINFTLNNLFDITKDIEILQRYGNDSSLNSSVFQNDNLLHSPGTLNDYIYNNRVLYLELKKYYGFYKNISNFQEHNNTYKQQNNIYEIQNFTPSNINFFDTSDDNRLTAITSDTDDYFNASSPKVRSLNLKSNISFLKMLINDFLIQNNTINNNGNNKNIFLDNLLYFIFTKNNFEFIQTFYSTIKNFKDNDLITQDLLKEYINILILKIKYIIDTNRVSLEERFFLQIFIMHLLSAVDNKCESLQLKFILSQNISIMGQDKICNLIEKIDKACSVNMNDYNFLNQKQQCLLIKQKMLTF